MSLRVLADHSGIRLFVGSHCFVYGDKVHGLSTLISNAVSVSGEVSFTVGLPATGIATGTNRTHLLLQESLARRLESVCDSRLVYLTTPRGHKQVVLTTDIYSLLRSLLSKGEQARLLFDDDSRLREWGKKMSCGTLIKTKEVVGWAKQDVRLQKGSLQQT